jgi:hypothetical protein
MSYKLAVRLSLITRGDSPIDMEVLARKTLDNDTEFYACIAVVRLELINLA